MLNILVINHHDSFVFNLIQLLRETGRCCITVVIPEEIQDIDLSEYQGILLSPGPGLPQETPQLDEVIRRTKNTHSILGICLGFQALALHFGGKMQRLEFPRHGHATNIHIPNPNHPLLYHIPEGSIVGRYHSWIIDKDSLPPCLQPIAWGTEDRLLMAFAHRTLPIFGLQYHPESIITEHGAQYINNWLDIVAVTKACVSNRYPACP
ncbi:aminodeoxychorismate/anthranilate synthase component II [Porphyromonas pogonae]|uniref:anthranilate synthase component II n=1 Tax=Porphyromonas pogonae TaxID=867595 RepID=UPI002E769C76|nr:aminodeoxychorismate/anthranilate synthase component II [Porphyromonas pogonae]